VPAAVLAAQLPGSANAEHADGGSLPSTGLLAYFPAANPRRQRRPRHRSRRGDWDAGDDEGVEPATVAPHLGARRVVCHGTFALLCSAPSEVVALALPQVSTAPDAAAPAQVKAVGTTAMPFEVVALALNSGDPTQLAVVRALAGATNGCGASYRPMLMTQGCGSTCLGHRGNARSDRARWRYAR